MDDGGKHAPSVSRRDMRRRCIEYHIPKIPVSVSLDWCETISLPFLNLAPKLKRVKKNGKERGVKKKNRKKKGGVFKNKNKKSDA